MSSDQPTVVEEPEVDQSTEPEPDDRDDDPQPDGDVEEVQVELTDDELGGGLFDGVEESESDDESGSESSESDSPDDVEVPEGGNLDGLEAAINEGAARLAIVGLAEDDFDDGKTPDDLEGEFLEVFEAFRLGKYGAQTLDEYVLGPDDEEVDPAWGLAGSMLLAAALVVWMRPDGDERVSELHSAVDDLAGGLL